MSTKPRPPRRSPDFGYIKEVADVERIARDYGIVLRGHGAERSTRCPFHEDRHPSFVVNVVKKVFYCHACGAKGDVIHLVAQLEDCSLPEAADRIAGRYGLSLGEDGSRDRSRPMSHGRPVASERRMNRARGEGAKSNQSSGEAEINRPLRFALSVDPTHPYLKARGLVAEVVEHFGLGYCASGMMAGRIAIPIHRSEDGALLAYAGRWTADQVPPGTLRYLFPRGFRKTSVLYNLHRVRNEAHLVVVEGFWSVFRLHALGLPSVALMGCSLSARQEELLHEAGVRRLTLLLDGDEAGRKRLAVTTGLAA